MTASRCIEAISVIWRPELKRFAVPGDAVRSTRWTLLVASGTVDEQVRSTASEQYGLIRRSDARRLGFSDRQIRGRVANGRWTRITGGVFALAAIPGSIEQDTLAAAWAVDGAASHRSCAWLAGVLDTAPDVPDVTSLHRRGRELHPERLTLHRSDHLPPTDLTRRRGIPTTTVERLICELGAVADAETVQQCTERALRLGLTHLDRLIARHLELAGRGRPGSAIARQVLADIDPDLSLLESELEADLLKLLVAAGLPRPTLQHPVEVEGRRYRIDMAYPELRIAIEADGFEVHGSRPGFESDCRRQNALVLAGWQVLRFTWRQVCREPEWVIAQVRSALDRATRRRA